MISGTSALPQTKAELTTLTNYLRDPAELAARSRRHLRDSPWQKPVKAELEVSDDHATMQLNAGLQCPLQEGELHACDQSLFWHVVLDASLIMLV